MTYNWWRLTTTETETYGKNMDYAILLLPLLVEAEPSDEHEDAKAYTAIDENWNQLDATGNYVEYSLPNCWVK